MPVSARTIFIIRHGEKPASKGAPYGVDVDGNQDQHSLIAQGWPRAGGLVRLFAPYGGEQRAGLAKPDKLYSPGYGDQTKTDEERTYETIHPLSQLLGLTIDNTWKKGEEGKLGAHLAGKDSGVALVCWEHHAIHLIANAITPIAPHTTIPQDWPDERFDVVFCFVYDSEQSCYVFSQVPQMLLYGDVETTIPA